MATMPGPSNLAAMTADLRPLGARSVIASTLLGANAESMPAERLVRTGELFGVADGAIRTALWRMVAAGELVADDGRYALAGPLLERRERFDTGPARRREWDGSWELAVVTAERRSAVERQDLRQSAAALHFAELREGVWVRPDNLERTRLPERQAVVDDQCVRFVTATLDGDREGLAVRLFDLDRWAARAGALILALDAAGGLPPALGPGDLADGFRVSIAAVRHLAIDPLLPDELLPPDWPGDTLRQRYADYHRAFDERMSDWLSGGEPNP
jgi:phenylacetic acid degradation operon negative regulatory protein